MSPTQNTTRNGYRGRTLVAAGAGTATWPGVAPSRTTTNLAGLTRHAEKFGPDGVPEVAREEGLPPLERGRLNVELKRIHDEHYRLHGRTGAGRRWAMQEWQPTVVERKGLAFELLVLSPTLNLSVGEVARLTLLSKPTVRSLIAENAANESAGGRGTPLDGTEAKNSGRQGGSQGFTGSEATGGSHACD